MAGRGVRRAGAGRVQRRHSGGISGGPAAEAAVGEAAAVAAAAAAVEAAAAEVAAVAAAAEAATERAGAAWGSTAFRAISRPFLIGRAQDRPLLPTVRAAERVRKRRPASQCPPPTPTRTQQTPPTRRPRVSALSRYARSLSAGWSSMQSEHNARTQPCPVMQAALARNMLRHNGIHLGIASAAPHATGRERRSWS